MANFPKYPEDKDDFKPFQVPFGVPNPNFNHEAHDCNGDCEHCGEPSHIGIPLSLLLPMILAQVLKTLPKEVFERLNGMSKEEAFAEYDKIVGKSLGIDPAMLASMRQDGKPKPKKSSKAPAAPVPAHNVASVKPTKPNAKPMFDESCFGSIFTPGGDEKPNPAQAEPSAESQQSSEEKSESARRETALRSFLSEAVRALHDERDYIENNVKFRRYSGNIMLLAFAIMDGRQVYSLVKVKEMTGSGLSCTHCDNCAILSVAPSENYDSSFVLCERKSCRFANPKR